MLFLFIFLCSLISLCLSLVCCSFVFIVLSCYLFSFSVSFVYIVSFLLLLILFNWLVLLICIFFFWLSFSSFPFSSYCFSSFIFLSLFLCTCLTIHLFPSPSSFFSRCSFRSLPLSLSLFLSVIRTELRLSRICTSRCESVAIATKSALTLRICCACQRFVPGKFYTSGCLGHTIWVAFSQLEKPQAHAFSRVLPSFSMLSLCYLQVVSQHGSSFLTSCE